MSGNVRKGRSLWEESVSSPPNKFGNANIEKCASVGHKEKTIVRTSLGSGTVRHGIDGKAYFIFTEI